TDFSDDGAKKLFVQNKDKFTFYTQINANIYLSNNPQTLENIKNTKVKVLAGAGSNATHEAVDLAEFAEAHGADGILSVAPYYNKPTQEGLYLHYKNIANSVKIPVLL
ncbi:hypothetical protein PO81_06565, partial [Vibrio parahaemolyticus]